jgi:hypothetical protein
MAKTRHRLQVGPLTLVPAGRAPNRQRLWAIPGGALATHGEVAEYARRMGWPKPVMVLVSTETEWGAKHESEHA